MKQGKLNLVLVRPIYPRNIGYCSRAAMNMACNRLIIIDAQCDASAFAAQQSASGAQEIYRNRREYSSWSEFYAEDGQGLRIALTRRDGKDRESPELGRLLEFLKREHPPDTLEQDVFLFMGPEDVGLNAEDISRMHFNAKLPVPGYPSLNLAHASLLTMHMVQEFFRKYADEEQEKMRQETQEWEFDESSLFQWLELIGNDLSHPTKSIGAILRRMILRSVPTPHELESLEKVLQNTNRLLTKNHEADRQD